MDDLHDDPTARGPKEPLTVKGEQHSYGDTTPTKRLGDFELLREIGRGGMGIVYEARQISLNRRVALKILPPGLGLTDTAVQRFEREARAAAKLHHTNIVAVHAIGEEAGHHYYAMEFVEGLSLAQILSDIQQEETQTLKEETITRLFARVQGEQGAPEEIKTAPSSSKSSATAAGRRWFDIVARRLADVADALDHAHGRGVVHRDIKPANLLLSPEGRLCITDFGLARIAQEPGMTTTGAFLGTPAYMSPEQARGHKLDHRSDIYSLGVVLYEMLTLQRPFTGESWEKIVHSILTLDPAGPRRINPRVPVDLETICLKAMEKDPDRRYATAEEFAEDLRQYLQHGLITARRAGIARRTWKSIRRHPVASIGTAAVIVLVLAAGTIWWATTARSHEMATRILSDARLDYREGDYNGALERAEEVLAIDPQLPGARFLRAQALMDLRRDQEAVNEAKSLLERNPDDWIAHMVLAQAALGIKSARFPELSAEEHIRALEEYAPESADAYYLRSLIGWQQDVRGALELLNRALELEPGHIDAVAHRIDINEALKNYPAALADAGGLIIARPRSPIGYVSKAFIQYKMHDIDRAMETINRAIELSPDNAMACSWRSTIFVGLGQQDEAIADLDRAIELQPDNSRWYTQRAGVYRARAEYEAAEADARRAIELDANNLQAFRELTHIYAGLGDRDSTRSLMDELLAVVEGWVDDDARAEARQLASDVFLHLGETDLALEQADLAVECDPDRPYAFIQRAKVKRRTDGASAAESDCEQAAAIELDNPELLFERSSSLAGDPCYRDDLAMADANRAVELSPNWADVYSLRGIFHNVERRFEESLLDLNRTVELAPAWGDAYFQRAWTYMHMERFEKALADYEECERLRIEGASHSNAWRMQAEALFRLGRDEEALETVHRIVESLPAAAYGHVQRANLLFWMGRTREAVAALDQAIEVEPAAPLSYERRSRYEAFLPGGCERAAADLERYDELAQDNVSRWLNAAWIHSSFFGRACPEQADCTLALYLASRAAESDPGNGWYQEVLGVALYRSGLYREAHEALLRRLEGDPSNLKDADTLFAAAMVAWKLDRKVEARAYYDRGLGRMEFLRHSRDPYFIACQKEAAEVLGIED